MTAFNWRTRARAIALAGVGIALVSAVTVAAPQPGPGRAPGMGPGGTMVPPPLARLNLSEDQRVKVRAIFEKQREAAQATHEKLRGLQDQLRDAIFASPAADTVRAEELAGQIADLQAQQLCARVAAEIQVAALLTDEQRQQMAQSEARRPGRMRGRR